MKKLLLTLALGLFCVMQIEAQDFRIDNFHENVTDLTAARTGVKDNNEKYAALLRFAVRDNNFEFEPNLGILRQENATGEVRLFVPEGTKRITIRHPRLGLLRDYVIPIAIQSKTTYDAEIVITNTDYLIAMYGQSAAEVPEIKQEEPVAEVPAVEPPIVEEPVVDEPVQEAPVKEESKPVVIIPSNPVEFYAGLGFNAISTMGPSIHLGISYRMFYLEGGFVLGLDKLENINYTLKSQSTISETYDYSSSKVWARLGVNTIKDSKFQVSPQVGVSYNMISGTKKGSSNTDYFKTSNSTSVFGAVRFSYEVAKGLHLHVTPQFDFAVSSGDVFSFIKKADSKLKAWGEGFGVNAGLLYHF